MRKLCLLVGFLLLLPMSAYGAVAVQDSGASTGSDASTLNFDVGIQVDGEYGDKTISILDEGIRYATVSLTSAEVKALKATPQEIIAAPSPDHIIEVIACKLIYDYHDVSAFTESGDNLVLAYNDGMTNLWIGHWFEMTNFIDRSADMMENWYRGDCPEPRTICSIINTNVVLMGIGDGEIAGNAANDNRLNVYITYRIIKGGIGDCTLGY